MAVPSTNPPQFGILLRSFGKGADASALVNQAVTSDEEGYHSIWAAERLIVPDPPNQAWSKSSQLAFEEMTLLSYLAGVTKNVRLGTYVLLAPLRNPLVLLRQVTTLDVLSKGRVILGLGLGWMKEEFETSGIPVDERAVRTDELIRFLRKVWTDGKVTSFQGKFIKMGPAMFEPSPVQRPIPIWIGGMSVPALKRAGRTGDGWLPNAVVAPEVIRNSMETISAEAERRGRDPRAISRSCRLTLRDMKAEARQTIRTVESMRELGVDLFVVDFELGPREDSENIKAFSREVMKSF